MIRFDFLKVAEEFFSNESMEDDSGPNEPEPPTAG